jgi:hypothetical protein
LEIPKPRSIKLAAPENAFFVMPSFPARQGFGAGAVVEVVVVEAVVVVVVARVVVVDVVVGVVEVDAPVVATVPGDELQAASVLPSSTIPVKCPTTDRTVRARAQLRTCITLPGSVRPLGLPRSGLSAFAGRA